MNTAAAAAAAPRLPFSFHVMIGGMLVTGAMAGISVSPLFPAAAVALSIVLVRSARRELQTTVGAANDPLVDLLRGTVAELPEGSARELLADVTVATDQLLGATGPGPARFRLTIELEPLLRSSAAAARDLGQLDEQLRWLEAQPEHVTDLPDTWAKAVTETRTARDRLRGLLLELSAALGRARALAADGFESAGAELADLCRDFQAGGQR